jgi:uncharacterized protein (DUF362 family)
VSSHVVSVIRDPRLVYPDTGEYYSPDHAFPEYRLGHIAKKPNLVYAAVRQCLADARLDQENFGKSTWNPLRNYVKPGQSVFLLCNFVKHNITNVPQILAAKCTHASVIRPLIDYILLALSGTGSVSFGNAPLQSADWMTVTRETGAQHLHEFYTHFFKTDISVQLVDLRQHIVRRKLLGAVEPLYHVDDTEACIPVDLGPDSLLDQLYARGQSPKFRVLDYDPHRTERCHSHAKHIFLMSRRILQSDVIISVPKLKTHEKVGFTCGIKGCVGAVGHKDSLAHHRYGPPRSGGDEYPDHVSFLRPLSYLHEAVYSLHPGRYQKALHLLNCWSRKFVRRFTRSLSGSWPGNDTCWRMAVDLARIVEYAARDGCLKPQKQRSHIMLTDGIVAGEGDGPLSPRPVRLGYLSFSDNIAAGDYVNCLSMGFSPEKIPMLREAFRLDKYALIEGNSSDISLVLNGTTIRMKELSAGLAKKFLPPREWRRYL